MRSNKEVDRPLVRLTVPQRLMAAERFYREHNAALADGLRLAIAIVQPDGWQHIAPAWARGIHRPKPNAEGHVTKELIA